jgi:DASH complex subunit SPC19
MATSTGTSTNAPSYADCVSSLRTSLNFLESSVETLDSGVSDFPRLSHVLKTVRVRLNDSPDLLLSCSFLTYTLFNGLCSPIFSVRANIASPRYQHYELIPQPTLAAAEASLRDEIGPSIALLLSRADAQIERQDRRIETLKARAELQQGRLARPDQTSSSSSSSSSSSAQKQAAKKHASSSSRKLSGEDKLRARAVKQRKEALRYGMERLELEVLQKERELRKRLES